MKPLLMVISVVNHCPVRTRNKSVTSSKRRKFAQAKVDRQCNYFASDYIKSSTIIFDPLLRCERLRRFERN